MVQLCDTTEPGGVMMSNEYTLDRITEQHRDLIKITNNLDSSAQDIVEGYDYIFRKLAAHCNDCHNKINELVDLVRYYKELIPTNKIDSSPVTFTRLVEE